MTLLPDDNDAIPLTSTSATMLVDEPSPSSSFEDRKNDVFGSLGAIELAHREFHRSTESERKEIRKLAWRRPDPAREDLVAEKDSRDRKLAARHSPSRQPISQREHPFPRPLGPPPGSCRRHNRPSTTPTRHRGRHFQRDPAKWRHYDLSHVDEDAGLSASNNSGTGDANAQIAASFLNELRERRLKQQLEGDEAARSDKPQHRILFRASRGVKKSRSSGSPSSQPHSSSSTLSVGGDDDCDTSPSDQSPDDSSTGSFSSFRGRQVGKRRLQLRGRDGDGEESMSVDYHEGESDRLSVLSSQKSPSSEEEDSNGSVDSDSDQDMRGTEIDNYLG